MSVTPVVPVMAVFAVVAARATLAAFAALTALTAFAALAFPITIVAVGSALAQISHASRVYIAEVSASFWPKERLAGHSFFFRRCCSTHTRASECLR